MKRYLALLMVMSLVALPSHALFGHRSASQSELATRSPGAFADAYAEQVRIAVENGKRGSGYNGMSVVTGTERILHNLAKRSDYSNFYSTGREFLESLKTYPGSCIPNLTILSHGWGASRTSGGDGIPIAENSDQGFPATGIYTDERSRLKEINQSVNDYMASSEYLSRFARVNGRPPTANENAIVRARIYQKYDTYSREHSITLDDLKKASTGGFLRSRKIKFCDSCLIQVYACNISGDFIRKFAAATGCQIVYGTGKLRGGYKRDDQGKLIKDKNGAPLDDNTGRSDHIWQGYRSSRKVGNRYESMNTRNGNFVRVTPIKQGSKVVNVIEEDIGSTYQLFN